MARQYINLSYTITVNTTSDDYLPPDLEVTETINLELPGIDSKYIVVPAKVVEGVTERVITEHRAKVREYRDQQIQREKDERQRSLWEGGATLVTVVRDGDRLTIAPLAEPESTDDNTPTGTSIDDIAGEDSGNE